MCVYVCVCVCVYVCVRVCVGVMRISLEPLVRWISNLTGVLIRARVSPVPILTLYGLEMQKISLNIFSCYNVISEIIPSQQENVTVDTSVFNSIQFNFIYSIKS